MDFTIDQRIEAPVEAVQDALLDDDFVAATANLPRLGDTALLDHEQQGDIVLMRIRRRFTGDLNRAVRAVVDPARLTWVEEIRYDLPTTTGSHLIVPDNYADRLSAQYTTTLAALPGASSGEARATRRHAVGRLTVRAPIGAGRVERAIVDGLREYADAEAALLTRWTAERA